MDVKMNIFRPKHRSEYIRINDELRDQHPCDLLREKFEDNYYTDQRAWYFRTDHTKTIIYLTTYETAHYMLNCDTLQKLNNLCPKAIFIPMVTLMCLCPPSIVSRCNYECLYRNDDEAVGLDFGEFAAYLTPTDIIVDNLIGFDIVTRKRK